MDKTDANSKPIVCDVVEPKDFKLYVQWLYTVRFFIDIRETPDNDHPDVDELRMEQLGERKHWDCSIEISDCDYMGACVDCLIEPLKNWDSSYMQGVGKSVAEIIYRGAHEEHTARYLAVDAAVKKWDKAIYAELAVLDYDAPKRLWKDLMVKVVRLGQDGVDRKALKFPLSASEYTCGCHEYWKVD
ncbi:hypothetical protein P154DRAFT_538575 [Amniculicola lignicola CBS 123094]|uniref:Uncharacterized protein n=1 Tax=Amniculicola lignicola CBS 123094 TaxID=1392246 RepID=A0A6A5W459_9PLEO|nr:hypothetical protein P154DRAFT_538575 [Amniculicola lignicola CBS 123094]